MAIYYAKASLVLAQPGNPVDFIVPTGNFGNAYAGLIAQQMDFPVGKITVATNENDTLIGAIDEAIFAPKDTVQTNTPAMDIQTASNFERIIFDMDQSDGKVVLDWTG